MNDFCEKKVLVTGGAGFIGSHVSEKLLNEGAEVTIFDNFSTGKMGNILQIKDKIRMIKGDIRDSREIANACEGQDLIIHEAFPYGVSTRSVEKQFTAEGAQGTFNVLRAALLNNVSKVVYASSVAVYGLQKYIPIDENHPVDPFLPYGATKYVGELYCSTFSKVYGLDTISLRYFNVYGPRYSSFDHSAMLIFLKNVINEKSPVIYGDGEQIRDYTYIDDAVEGTLLAAKTENTYGDVFNIGSGKGVKIIDLAKEIISINKKDLKPVFAKTSEYKFFEKSLPYGVTEKIGDKYVDKRNYIANINKAKKTLGYEPKVERIDGIKKTVEWMLKTEFRKHF